MIRKHWIFILLFLPLQLFAGSLTFSIKGIEGDLLNNVERRMNIFHKTISENPTNEAIKQFHAQANEQIKLALQPFGFYKPEITSDLKQTADNWRATYTIYPGPPLSITQLDLRLIGPGEANLALINLLANFPLNQGDILNIQKYQSAKKTLFDQAQHQGFLDAIFSKQEVIVDLNSYTATVHLYLQTGQQYFFGEVHFAPSVIDDELLYRYIPFQPGQPYSTTHILSLQEALGSSGYFSSVKIEPQLEATEQQFVPITVFTEPAKSQVLSFGAGYGTDTGARLSASSHWRRLNAKGHSVLANAFISENTNVLRTKYIIPGNHPVTSQYELSANLFDLKLPRSNSQGGRLTAAHVTTQEQWQRTIAINALHERFFDADGRRRLEAKQATTLLYPSITWKNIVADNRIFPNHGHSIEFTVLGGSSVSKNRFYFAQAQASSKVVRSYFDQNLRLLLRASGGVSFVDDIENLPPSLRLYAGGEQSVRGYTYNSLGSGRYKAVASAELQFRLNEDWYLATFFDIGNVSNDISSMFKNTNRGIGAGIIRKTPLGSIRVGVAQGIDAKNKPIRFIFSMGADL